MRCLWLWLLLLACALHADAVAVAVNGAGGKAGRHGHLQHLQHLPDAPASKLRHRGAALKSAASAEDKYPKLRELSRRLEKKHPAATTSRTPYFFAARTKDRPRWKYVHDYEEPAPLEDVDEEYDSDAEDEDYVDAVRTSTSTSTTTEAALAYDEETPDEDANDDYYDDEIYAEDTFRPQHDVQAEEGHEQSPMTRYKWQKYGTREALEESQRHSDSGHNDRKNVKAANEHYLHMKSAAKCRLPRARVINVHEVHQLPGKAFRPHCTVLHRCGEDTGCCQGQGKKCRAKTQETIYLHFYVFSTSFGQSQQSVERLKFDNHTECACLDDTEMKSPQRIVRSRGHYSHNSVPQEKPSCKCPEEFIPTVNHRFGRCACDCPPGSDAHSGCMNMKRGKEHLSLRDRKCIIDGKCTPPVCEYGTYAKPKGGRCPRRHESASGASSTASEGNTLRARSDSDNDDYSMED